MESKSILKSLFDNWYMSNEAEREKKAEGEIQSGISELARMLSISQTETRTPLTYNGKPIFTKSITFTLEPGDTSQTSIDLGVAMDSVILVRGFVREANGTTHGILNSNLSIAGQPLTDTTQLNAWFAIDVTTSYIIYSDGFGGLSGEAWFAYTKVMA